MNNAITVSHLKKTFGKLEAVKDLSFYVEEGSLFAFLGTNGAGKSTTIDCLCTLSKPTGGSVTINGLTLGKDDKEIRRKIGIVFQDSVLDTDLTVKENLQVRGSFYGLKGIKLKEAVNKVSKSAQIEDFLNRPYGKLSGGQRRRADIARALINTPDILFLDEPTTGLDPQTRQTVWDTIRTLQKETGMTVFLTTHYMEEAAKADYVAVISTGELVAKGTPNELKQAYTKDYLHLTPTDRKKALGLLDELSLTYEKKGDLISIPLTHTTQAIDILWAMKPYIDNFEVVMGNMDDAFLEIARKAEQTNGNN